MREATDAGIRDYSSAENVVVITKDSDFVDLYRERPAGCRLVWVRIGNCRRDALLNLIRELWPRIVERLDQGEQLIEIR